MQRLKRIPWPIGAAVALAVAILLGFLAWQLTESWRQAGRDGPPARAVRADVSITEHFGQDYTTVVARYRLLKSWPEPTLPVAALDSAFIHLDVTDRTGDLEPSLGDWEYYEHGGVQWLDIPLRSTEAGYTFTVIYEFNATTPLPTLGDMEYPSVEGNEQTRLTLSLPDEGAEVWPGRTSPRPESATRQGGSLNVSFNLESWEDGVNLVYRPRRGYGPARARTVTTTAGGAEYTFHILYPPAAREAADDVEFFARQMFPVLVEEVGSPPHSLDFWVYFTPGTPADPWTLALYSRPGEITFYLQNLTTRPSLVMGHEIVHDYIGGYLPIYWEEGLADLVSDGWVSWDHGFVQAREPEVEADVPFETSELAEVAYGAETEAVAQGYDQGADLIYLLEGELGADVIREMVQILGDEDADLQTVICASGRGPELFGLLDDLDLVAEPGAAGLLPEEDGKLELYDWADCTPATSHHEPVEPVRRAPRRVGSGMIAGLLSVGVLLTRPRLRGLLLIGAAGVISSAVQTTLDSYPLAVLAAWAWLPAITAILGGAMAPMLMARLLPDYQELASPWPTWPQKQELDRQVRGWQRRLALAYGVSLLPAAAVALTSIALVPLLPQYAGFLEHKIALLFGGCYALWAAVAWSYALKHAARP